MTLRIFVSADIRWKLHFLKSHTCMQVRSIGKWEEGEFLPQVENEKNNLLVSRGILENRRPRDTETVSEDTASWRVRHTCPEGRHPKYLHGGEDGMSWAGPVAHFPATTISNPNYHQATKWPAGATDVGRGVGVAIGRTSSTRGSGGDAGRGGAKGGWKGVGMRVTSGGLTRIWNIKGQTFQRWFFLLIPKIGGDDPIWLAHVFFFTWVSWNHQLETNDGKMVGPKKNLRDAAAAEESIRSVGLLSWAPHFDRNAWISTC